MSYWRVYIILRRDHYIMLIIELDSGKVQVLDSLAWPKELYQDIIDALQR